MNIHVIVEEDEAGFFVAEVPAFPGCMTQGRTREEALENLKEAVAGWIEVMEEKEGIDRTRMLELAV